MLFTLEALRAEAGDCLLLHYGDVDEPQLVLIDGGPTKAVYRRLDRRLRELRETLGFGELDQLLPIELLMISHIDDDHIDGILHLTRQLIEEPRDNAVDIFAMWHNSFDDVIGNRADELSTAAHGDVAAASAGGDFLAQDLVGQDTALILASVNQGRELRDNAKKLALDTPLIVAEKDEQPRNFGAGMTLRVVGPLRAQLDALHDEWEKQLRKLEREGKLAAASFADRSAANLASLVVLAEADGKSMLLTGDARGDFLVKSLEDQGLLDDQGHLHVDLFKLPHHGSSRNTERSTFRTITADHYVISADGKHGNPDVETFDMLFGGREDAGVLHQPFTLYLTYAPEDYRPHHGHDYPLAELNRRFDQARRTGHRFTVVHPAADEESVKIDLLEALPH